MKIPILGEAVSAVAGAYKSKQQTKSDAINAAAAVRTNASDNNTTITLTKVQAQALVNKAAVDGLQTSWKDELMTATVAFFFFLWPAFAAAFDAVFNTGLLAAHLGIFDVLIKIPQGSDLGAVFKWTCLAAVGMTGYARLMR